MKNFFLVPVIDALIRDPETMIPLSPEGEWKPANAFWRRRLRDGEVNDMTPQPLNLSDSERAQLPPLDDFDLPR